MFPGATMLPECCHDTYVVMYSCGVFLTKNCSFSFLVFLGFFLFLFFVTYFVLESVIPPIKIVSIILILPFIVFQYLFKMIGPDHCILKTFSLVILRLVRPHTENSDNAFDKS